MRAKSQARHMVRIELHKNVDVALGAKRGVSTEPKNDSFRI